MKTKSILLLSLLVCGMSLFQSCNKDEKEISNSESTETSVSHLKSAPTGAIVPGTKWYDTNGKEILCQGGEIYQENGVFYWVGNIFVGNNWAFQGINLYSSTDLKNWRFLNTILTPTAVNGETKWVGRPLLAKKPNGEYIMFVGTDWTGHGNLGYATCSTLTGNYSWKGIISLLGKYQFNDHDIFRDADGSTYLVCSTAQDIVSQVWYDAVIAKCDPNTLLPTWENIKFGDGGVEGVSLFKRGSYYYFFASQKYWWNGTNTKWYKASSLAGFANASWNTYTDFFYYPGTANGWDAQNDFILNVKGNYYYCADRWSNFTGRGDGRYIWLPLKFNASDYAWVDWYDWWNFNPATGSWSSSVQNGMAGGFETNDNGNWLLSGGATIVQDLANSYTGSHCAKLPKGGVLYGTAYVVPGATYKLQVMGKTASCIGKIYVKNSSTGYYAEASVSKTTYTATSLSFTAPANVTSVEIGILNATTTKTSTFYADNFELIKQ